MKNEISRRQYAKRRGVSETAIRKRIADGSLAKAMTADGLIDADKADKLLAQNTTAGSRISLDLSEARRRKSAASVALLADEIEALEGSVLPQELADKTAKRLSLLVAGRLLRIAPDIAAQVAGKSAAIAASIIDNAVFMALTEISETPREVAGGNPAKGKKGKAFGAMSLVELATVRADLHARKLELERGVKRHEMISLAKFESQLMHRVMVMKQNISGMHAKLAPRFANANAAKAKAILTEELNRTVEVFACRAVTKEQLRAARPAKTILLGPQ